MAQDLRRTTTITPPDGGAGGTKLRRPWWSRLSRAHAVALVAALLAGGLNLAALARHDHRVAVLVAATDLPHGARLGGTTVREVALSADSSLLHALVPADRLAAHDGWLLTRAVAAGEPLRWSDLRDPGRLDGLRAMSVPVEPEHAADGALQAGDRVDVIAVREGRSIWLVADVEVLAVGDLGGGGLSAPRPYAVTLAVTEQQALRLAWAMHDGAVELVRATGAPGLADSAATVGSEALS